MTVIAAIKANDKVYLGCDSMFLDTGSLQATKRTQSKLIIKDEMVIGLTTNGCRIFQTIQYKLKVPSTRKVKTEDLLEYFITKFCGSLYKLLHAENMLIEDSDAKTGEPCLSPASALIGIRGKLFHIGEDFDVAELDMPFYAVGGGGEYAIGALEASTVLAQDFKPDDHILHALKTAEKYTAGVKGPYQLVNTETLCLWQCS